MAQVQAIGYDEQAIAQLDLEQSYFSQDVRNLSPNLSPTRREAFIFPPSLVGKGARGLGFSWIFPYGVKSQEQYVQWQASAVAQFSGANYSLQSTTQGFLSTGDNPNTPIPNQTSPERSRGANSQASPERQPIRHTLIGSPKAVNSTIRVLHQLK